MDSLKKQTQWKIHSKDNSLLEENLAVNPHDLRLGNDFLYRMPKAQLTRGKVDKMDYIKMKSFVHQRTLGSEKTTHRMRGICQNYIIQLRACI